MNRHCSFIRLYLNKHVACGAINSHKQIATGRLIWHLRQVFETDVDEDKLLAFEGFI